MAEKKMFSATGNQMVADAFRQVNPDVMAAYPITPQTTIVEGYAKFVADGKVTTEYVPTESEHSALSACIGASAAGARVATATSSQGLAYMWEELHIASGMRCPIVMANANRALSAPINIHGDHSDIMSARDCGWGMMFAETAQEAYDNTIIAFKVAEDPNVLLFGEDVGAFGGCFGVTAGMFDEFGDKRVRDTPSRSTLFSIPKILLAKACLQRLATAT